MAKKGKVKKTLVDQILDKAKIDHDSLSFNGLAVSYTHLTLPTTSRV